MGSTRTATLDVFYHRCLLTAGLACVFLSFPAGCSSAAAKADRAQLAAARSEPLPLEAAEEVEGSASAWAADPKRLPDDVERAIRRSYWGVLRLEVEREPAIRVLARALLPDGRTAEIEARALDEATVSATVHVGQFGDAEAEAAYLTTLKKTLAGKPKPYRNWKYKLPDE